MTNKHEQHIRALREMRSVMLEDDNWENLQRFIEAVTAGGMAIQMLDEKAFTQPKTGHWIVDGSVDCYLDKVRCHCSECEKKKEFPADYDHIKQELSISYKYLEFIDNFCPNCGTKMVDPQEGGVNNG